MTRLVLDAGAFIAFERGVRAVRAELAAAHRLRLDVFTITPVVSQVWRDGTRQAMLARLLASTRVVAPDLNSARRAGELLALTRGKDVVDALLIERVLEGDRVLTSDIEDLTSLLDAARVSAALVRV